MSQAEEYEALADHIAAVMANLDEGLAANNQWGFALIKNSRNAEHRGDCTKESFSCLQCGYMEMTIKASAILAEIIEKAKDWPTRDMRESYWHRKAGNTAYPDRDWRAMLAASPLVKPASE